MAAFYDYQDVIRLLSHFRGLDVTEGEYYGLKSIACADSTRTSGAKRKRLNIYVDDQGSDRFGEEVVD
jgi:hypothetical protein